MKKVLLWSMLGLLALNVPVMSVSATDSGMPYQEAQMEQVNEYEDEEGDITRVEAEVTSGTFGDNNGFQWIYDATTKTLTVTGADSGLNRLQEDVPENVIWAADNVVFRNCKVSGSLEALLSGLNEVKSVIFDNFDTQNVTDMSYMFDECYSLSELDLSSFNTQNVTDMSHMFAFCNNLSELEMGSFNTQNVTNMSGMFYECACLSELDLGSFDTKKVANMSSMFCFCINLSELDLSSFDTKNVTNMAWIFAGSKKLTTLNLSGFNTQNVTDMSYMFGDCSSLTELDLSGFDTKNVTNMSSMFYLCNSLSELDLSSFDTQKVTNMSGMFHFCINLSELDLSGFNTKNVTNMEGMFCGIGLTELDLSSFETKNVINMGGMFNACSALTSLDLSSFEITDACALYDYFYGDVFNGCTALKQISAPKAMAEGKETALPTTFYDLSGNAYNVLNSNSNGKVLVIDQSSIIQVKAFVERMYTVALGRNADASGVDFWTNQLLGHKADGAGLAEGFILSDEFVEKGYSDAEYIKVLYATFFNREADEGGIGYWTSQLNAGQSRRSVLAGFVNSQEFDELCTAYGIERGNMEADEPADVTPDSGIQGFVERLYVIALERASEPAGLADWTARIKAGEISPQDVAKFFFLSDEYTEKGTDNDKYIETVYLVFMDRASEATGKAYWVSELEKGMVREAVLDGFAWSKEFREIMKKYGL